MLSPTNTRLSASPLKLMRDRKQATAKDFSLKTVHQTQ